MTDKTICRDDGRCEYAIQSGAEGNGHCPNGKCAMPASAPGTGSDTLDCILGVGGFASFGPLDSQPAAHLTIPGALEWDRDTHGVVGTHSADGEHGESSSVVSALKAFANEMIAAAFECGSFDGGDIQDIAVKNGLLQIEQRTEECGEVCACREYGFPAECYRKTDLLKPADEPAEPAVEAGVVSAPKPYAAMTEAEADEFLSSFGGGSGNKAKRRIAAMEAAKQKTCIECDQPYCHGVCVERGDQDYDRDQAAKGGDDE